MIAYCYRVAERETSRDEELELMSMIEKDILRDFCRETLCRHFASIWENPGGTVQS